MRKAVILTGILLLSAATVAESAALARGGKSKGFHRGGVASVKVVVSKDMGLRTWDKGSEKNLSNVTLSSVEGPKSPSDRTIVRAGKVQSPVPLLPVVSQPDILPEDQVFLDRVLRSLPTICTENLQQVVVRYSPKAERGQATSTTMILRGPLASLTEREKKEMAAVIVHELCGHGVDLGKLQGHAWSGESAYPDAHIPTYNDDESTAFYAISWKNPEEKLGGARKDHFVTGYAMKDPFEDVAESITYFLLQEQAFRERAAQNPILAAKLQWIETYVFPEGRGLALGAGWNGSIPWDATKLASEFTF